MGRRLWNRAERPDVVPVGATVVLDIGTTSSGVQTCPSPAPNHTPASCSSSCMSFTYSPAGSPCPQGNVCARTATTVVSKWTSNCCTFGRMTTIARTTADDFRSATDATEVFRPIQCSSPFTSTCVSGKCNSEGAFKLGGYQSYPILPGIVKVSGPDGSSAETDSIIMPPLQIQTR